MAKKRYKSNRIAGKLRVCNYLKRHPELRRLVPLTVSFSRPNLHSMSRRFRALYIKPNIGSQGIGVHKLERLSSGYRLIYIKGKQQKKRRFASFGSAYEHLKAKQPPKFIIQRAINLDTLSGRPYDIRAMVQRRPGGPWTCTGFMVKVGSKRKIVTNYYQGGKLYTIQQLLKLQGYPEAERNGRIGRLTEQAEAVARYLSSKRSGMREMGIDFAYDTNGRLWILEVNSNHPQFRPLKKLDRKAYNRMRSFAKSYGRYDDY